MKQRSTIKAPRATGTQAISRALAVLQAFRDATPEWGLADLSRHLAFTKTTTLRLLSALERERMVARSMSNGGYRLGPGAIELGALAQRSNPLHRAALPELEELSRLTGETCSLEVLVDADILIVAEVQGHHKLTPAAAVGERWPAHCASTGKVLLAAAVEARGPGVIRTPLARLTPRTITSPARLATELARVARQGYATAVEELAEGYVAVGAPVRNHDGVIIAALSIGGPSSRFTPARLTKFSRLIRETADRVSRRLGSGGIEGKGATARHG
ncbi:MAG: IclR family transcriptional regulator [Gemmatimonadota bacterium]